MKITVLEIQMSHELRTMLACVCWREHCFVSCPVGAVRRTPAARTRCHRAAGSRPGARVSAGLQQLAF